MKILKKHNTLIHYTFDPLYFEKYAEMTQLQYASSHWRAGPENSLVLQYDVFFSAKNPSNGAYFVNYHHRFDLQCQMENIEADVKEVVMFKDVVHASAQLFLMQNTQDQYHLLDFHDMTLRDKTVCDEKPTRESVTNHEIASIKKAMEIKP